MRQLRATALVAALIVGGGLSSAAAVGGQQAPERSAAPVAGALAGPFVAGDHRGEDLAILPAAVPGATPAVRDGAVLAIVQVGNRVILGGNFSGVADAGGGTSYDQPHLLSYDLTTGLVDPAFRPVLSGDVLSVAAAADGRSVYVGGVFKEQSTGANNLLRLDVATGAPVAGFRAPKLNGRVADLALSGSRLFVAGSFTQADRQAHGGLVAVDAATGAAQHSFATLSVATHFNWPQRANNPAPVGINSIAVSPDGRRMTAIGNFRSVNGQARYQVFTALIDATSGVTVDPNWSTNGFLHPCGKKNDSYVREVDYSPDGTYWVVVTTGGSFTGALCDAASRFEAGATGTDVRPTWTSFTGCDTVLSVEITTAAVYVGGHFKWFNVPDANCKVGAQPGSVPRPGLAALTPTNGVPMTWNPGRHPRGTGAAAIYANEAGVFVGSDTDYVGNRRYLRPKVAFFPAAGGATPVTQPAPVLAAPLQQLNGSAGPTVATSRSFAGTSAGAPTSSTLTGSVSFAGTVGGFMVGSKYVYARPSASALFYRTLVNGQFGPEVLIDPYNDPAWSNVDIINGGRTFRGLRPAFYTSVIPRLTSMTYVAGRVYYTTGGPELSWLPFSPDSLTIGSTATTTTAPDMTTTRSLFYAADALWRTTSGSSALERLTFTGGRTASGAWVRQTGTGITGADFSGTSLFIGPRS